MALALAAGVAGAHLGLSTRSAGGLPTAEPEPAAPAWPSTRTALGLDLPAGACVLYFGGGSSYDSNTTWWCRVHEPPAAIDAALTAGIEALRDPDCETVAVRAERPSMLRQPPQSRVVCVPLKVRWQHKDHALLRITTHMPRRMESWLLAEVGFRIVQPEPP